MVAKRTTQHQGDTSSSSSSQVVCSKRGRPKVPKRKYTKGYPWSWKEDVQLVTLLKTPPTGIGSVNRWTSVREWERESSFEFSFAFLFLFFFSFLTCLHAQGLLICFELTAMKCKEYPFRTSIEPLLEKLEGVFLEPQRSMDITIHSTTSNIMTVCEDNDEFIAVGLDDLLLAWILL